MKNVRLACIQLQLDRLGQDDARVLGLLRSMQRIMGDKAAGAVLQRGATTLQAVVPGVLSSAPRNAGILCAVMPPNCAGCHPCIDVRAHSARSHQCNAYTMRYC